MILAVMLDDDLDVMFVYDLRLKAFKMPHTHILLQLSLYFNQRVPHFDQRINTLIDNLKQLIHLVNEIIIKLLCFCHWLWRHLLLLIHVCEFLLDELMKIASFQNHVSLDRLLHASNYLVAVDSLCF